MVSGRSLLRIFMGLVYVVAGINHFHNPRPYIHIMPPYLPAHEQLVALSGCAEVVFGVLAMLPRTARFGGWGLVALLAAVFPANLHMALHPDQFQSIPAWALWLRLPLQPLLMALAYWSTK